MDHDVGSIAPYREVGGMKSLTGKFTSVRGWGLLLALLLGAGLMISACGDEEVPTPTTPAPPPPAPTPTPTPTPTPEPTGPATPANLRVANSGHNFIEWTWNAVEGASGYNAQFSADATFTDADRIFVKTTAAQTSHRIDNLEGNTTGHMRVQTYVVDGTAVTRSDWSATSSGTTTAPPTPPPATALSAPSGLTATDREDDSITLGWNAVADADTYEVEQRTGSAWSDATCGGSDNVVETTACVASGLTEATEYNFRVRALPDSADATLAASVWTQLAAAVSTTGTAPPTTVTGGDDDLGLRWANNSDGTEIVWDWAPVADRADRLRVEHRLNLQNASTGDQDCPMLSDVADTDTLVPADGLIALGDTWINAGSGTSARFAASPNTTYQFCVVRTWEDERGVRQFGKDIAHALAAALPAAPTVPNNQPEIFDAAGTSTTKYRWGVTLRRGFDYDVRVVSGLVGSFATPTNDQCSDGTPASITGPARQQSVAETYEASATSKYTDYGLCYRAKNDDGQSQWAKTISARTTLPATPGLGSASWRDNNATMVVSFSDKDTLPSSDSRYDVHTFVTDKSVNTATQKAACNGTAPDVAGVSVLASPQSGGSPTPLANSWEVTFAHGQTKKDVDPPVPASIHVYVCVRAKRDATSEGNASPWAIKSASRTNAQLPG